MMPRNPWSAWSSCRNALNPARLKSSGRKIGQLILLSVTAGLAASAVDDILVFQQCSNQALEKAEQNQRVKEILGPMKRGGWNEATIGFSEEGRLLSCSFPVYGRKGTGEIRLKAMRRKDHHIWRYISMSGNWQLFVVEAYVYQVENGERILQRISLT